MRLGSFRGLAAITCGLSTCVILSAQSSMGRLAEMAAAAKARGENHVVREMMMVDIPFETGLKEVIQTNSLVLATLVGRPAVQVVQPDFIETWRVLRLVRALASGPSAPSAFCSQQLPASLSLRSGELALGLVSGSTTIDGVSVTVRGVFSRLEFTTARQYLLVGTQCPSGVFALHHGASSVLYVSPAGRVTPEWPERPLPFARELVSLGTVSQIADYVGKAK